MKKLKAFKAIAILVLMITLLAGCKSTPVETSNTDSSIEQEVGTESGYPRTVKHLSGEITFTEAPKKVVVLSASYIDHLLVIGEKPIGVPTQPQYGGHYIPYLANQIDGAVIVGSWGEYNFETILELEPDLIIAEIGDEIEQLEKIAATLVLGSDNYDEDKKNPDYWQSDLMKIAEVFNKVEVAEDKLNQLESKVAKAREKIISIDKNKLAFLRIRKDTFGLYAKSNHPLNFLLYSELGFKPSDLTHETDYIDMSLELIPELAADYIFMQVDGGGADNLNSIKESPLWQVVPAVKNDDVLAPEYWVYKAWGAIGRQEIIDEILEFIK